MTEESTFGVLQDESILKDHVTTTNSEITPSSSPPSSKSDEKNTVKVFTEDKGIGFESSDKDLELDSDTFLDASSDNKPESRSPVKKTNVDVRAEEYRDIAKKLYKEEFVSIKPEEYTQFLAASDVESSQIRMFYMDSFKWDPNLLTATRMLCSKLYLRGESQEIDRILTSFTASFVKQHPNTFFSKKGEEIYVIVYSLILLNTSLHNSEINKKSRITQSEYVKNTYSTFINQNPRNSKKLTLKDRVFIERELGLFYNDLAKNQLYLKSTNDHSKGKLSNDNLFDDIDESPGHELKKETSNSSIWSDNGNPSLSSNMKWGASSETMHSFSGSNRKGFTRALISDQNKGYRSTNGSRVSSGVSLDYTLRNRQSLEFLRGAPRSSGYLTKRTSRASIISKESNVSNLHDDSFSMLSFETNNFGGFKLDEYNVQADLDGFNVNDYQDQYDLTLELQGSPYLKEGLLKLKILNNDQQDNQFNDEVMPSSSSITSTKSTRSTSKIFSFFGMSNKRALPTQSSLSSSGIPILNKFIDNFVVVSKGELSLYTFDPKIVKKYKEKSKKSSPFIGLDVNENEAVGDGNWLKNAANIGNYNLCSTFAQVEKSGTYSSNTNAAVWSLTFPKTSKRAPKKFIFEAGTHEIALEFINTCNFWASKITAIPTAEDSVSSIEYGWTNLDGLINNKATFRKIKYLGKWEPIPRGVYLSSFVSSNDGYIDHEGMMKQFAKTFKYYQQLKKSYHEFTLLRSKFVKAFPLKDYSGANYSRVVNNFEAKVSEYKADLNKYKHYLIILGFALQLRFDLEEEDKKAEDDNELSDKTTPLKDSEDELKKLVKSEIENLFINMKDVGNVIPTFKSCRSIQNLTELARISNTEESSSFPLVKSPKTFTLSNYKDNESPINQLLQSSAPAADGTAEKLHSRSTNTIKEEEEPDD